MKKIVTILTCFLIANCSINEAGSNSVEKAQSPPNKIPTRTVQHDTASVLKNKHQEIEGFISKQCESSKQCKAIGVGVSPCGGFSSYQIYSTEDTDEKKLTESVEQFNQIMRVQNQKNNVVGICRHIEPPKVACQNNLCASLNSTLAL